MAILVRPRVIMYMISVSHTYCCWGLVSVLGAYLVADIDE